MRNLDLIRPTCDRTLARPFPAKPRLPQPAESFGKS